MTAYAAGLINKGKAKGKAEGKAEERIDTLVYLINLGISKGVLLERYSEEEYEEAEKLLLVTSSKN